MLGIPARTADSERSGDGLPREVLAIALAGGTVVLTATRVRAGRRRTFRARPAA